MTTMMSEDKTGYFVFLQPQYSCIDILFFCISSVCHHHHRRVYSGHVSLADAKSREDMSEIT